MPFKPHIYSNARRHRFPIGNRYHSLLRGLLESPSISAGEIDTREAARMLGITDNRVRQLVRAKSLSARRVNGTWLLNRAEVEGFTPPSQARETEYTSPASPTSVVYFVERDGFVKIGTTKHLAKRLASLSRGDSSVNYGISPGPVSLMATLPGDEFLEKRLHSRFSHLRIGGEWFCPDEELSAFIAQCASDS